MATKWLKNTCKKGGKNLSPLIFAMSLSWMKAHSNVSLPTIYIQHLEAIQTKKVKEEYKLQHPTTRQCNYCENYFASSKDKFAKHVKGCSSIEGIIYSFDNDKIISFQDNLVIWEMFLLLYTLILRPLPIITSFRTQNCL